MTLKIVEDNINHSNFSVHAGELMIGRAQDNDIKVPNKTISAHHARIYTYLNASFIEDLGSTNGIYLNGKRIYKHTLHNGDKIKLGSVNFEVIE